MGVARHRAGGPAGSVGRARGARDRGATRRDRVLRRARDEDENFRERTGIVGGTARVADVRYLDVLPLPGGGWRLFYEAPLPRRQPRAAHRAHRLGGVAEPRLITAVGDVPPSLARVEEPTRAPFRIGVVQEAWHPDAEEHVAALERGIAMAAGEGAQLVCMQELSLYEYLSLVQ